MTSDLRERLRRVDPAPVAAKPPSGAWESAAVLHRIERRMGMDTRDTTREPKPAAASVKTTLMTSPEKLTGSVSVAARASWSRARVALAAAVVVAVVASVYAVLSRDGEPRFDAASAQSIGDDYITAFNVGDTDAVLGLFAADAAYSFNFLNGTQQPVDGWKQQLAWNAAQGTMLEGASCAVADGVEGDTFMVTCVYQTVDAPSQAVGTQGVSTTATLTISSVGISAFNETFGRPDFDQVGSPFEGWVTVNHPQVAEGIGFGNWTSVEEAEQNGLLTAEYADLWNAYLTENGCTYNQSRASCLGSG